jgi:SAM-dependent methyltransferase
MLAPERDPMFDRYGSPRERYVELSEIYDHIFPYDADAAAAVDFLSALYPGGRILELGVGTGRIALPLAERGHPVVGVDTSPEMLTHLAKKDPDQRIQAVEADMADPPVDGRFGVITMLYNTIAALLGQELQIKCVASAASRLEDDGSFVVEAKVPVWAVSGSPTFNLMPFDEDQLRTLAFEVISHDHVGQFLRYRHVYLADDGVKILPSVHRYVHPAELDLMARLAGLELAGRYGDWERGPLHPNSLRHISVYRRGATTGR